MKFESSMAICFHLAIVIWSCYLNEAMAYGKFLRNLKGMYDFMEVPVGDEHGSNPLKVLMDITLVDIVQADTETNQVELIIWPELSWTSNVNWENGYLRRLYNVSRVRVPAKDIWKPDVVAYDATAPVEDIYPDTNVVLQRNGEVMYVPSQRLRVKCWLHGLDTDEGATCAIKFSSWTYDGNQMDLELRPETTGMELGYYTETNYKILNNTVARKVKHYACCPEPYPEIVYTFTFKSMS